jgi:Methyltransferase domain
MRQWALPESILAAAPEAPWGFPTELFRSRAELATPGALTFANRTARDALPSGGTVLDVGVGAGAASIPLHPSCGLITGVDSSSELLAEFQQQARRVGVAALPVAGAWPEVAPQVSIADVVVCNHVVYNVADLAPFVVALSAHARRRVVLELTSRHPTAWMADLWLRFHALPRPTRPDSDDAASLIRGLGYDVRRHAAVVPRRPGGFRHREDAVASIRRRLCLDAARDEEVAEALGDRLARDGDYWSAAGPLEPLVTLWWDMDGTVAGT